MMPRGDRLATIAALRPSVQGEAARFNARARSTTHPCCCPTLTHNPNGKAVALLSDDEKSQVLSGLSLEESHTASNPNPNPRLKPQHNPNPNRKPTPNPTRDPISASQPLSINPWQETAALLASVPLPQRQALLPNPNPIPNPNPNPNPNRTAGAAAYFAERAARGDKCCFFRPMQQKKQTNNPPPSRL